MVRRVDCPGGGGKIEGQPAHTREVKLGCVFTQTTTDAEGRPVRDEDSTSYVGAIEPAEQFGLRLYAEARRRGWNRAQKKVVLGDGAVWIWNLADQHFLGALQPGSEELAKSVRNEADYFLRNAGRMRYPAFRAQGLFVGSGVIEAGCKTVIGARLKCSGMFWTVRGANAMIALRCCRLSRRFEDYWADRASAA